MRYNFTEKLSVGRFAGILRRLVMSIFIGSACNIVMAQGPALQEKVNFHASNTTAVAVIESLDNQSHYSFSYTQSSLKNIRLKQVDFTNITLDRALDFLKTNAGLRFLVVENIISVKVEGVQKNNNGTSQKGKITGYVRDQHNNPLAGVSIMIPNSGQGTQTSAAGDYRLEVPAGEYMVAFSSIGFKDKKVTGVTVEAGQETSLNVVMETGKSVDLQGVIVTSRRQENTNALLLERKNSAMMTDGISSDLIRRTPDRNAGDAMKRITGASVLEGKYVVVRGLSDRYNYTMLNGSLLPSTEPDRRTFSLDLIPAEAIESIVINKTTTAEYLGEFAGGIVQVKTKDFPETNFLNVSVMSGFYNGITGKPFMADHKGSKDWLGYDDGARAIPKELDRTATQLNQLYAEERFRVSRLLSKGWAPQQTGTVAPIHQLQLGYGHTFNFSNSTRLGIIALARYRHDQTIDQVQRHEYPQAVVGSGATVPHGDSIAAFLREFPDEQQYHDIVNEGGILNIAYEFKKNRISLKNMFNRDFDNATAMAQGQAYNGSAGAGNLNRGLMRTVDMHLTQKTLLGFQLQGTHRFLDVNSPILTWNVSYNKIRKYEPGQTRQQYVNLHITDTTRFEDKFIAETGDIENSSRLFTNLTEDAYNVNFTIAVPFTVAKQAQLLKAGAYNQFRMRNYYTQNLGYVDAERALGMPSTTRYDASAPIDVLFSAPNFRPGGFVVASYELPANRYKGATNMASAFANMESNILPNLKLIYGARVEFFTMNLTTDKTLVTRLPNNGGVGDDQLPISYIRYTTDLLPSASLIYSPFSTMNIRAAWSKTLARPEFREVSPYQYYDFMTATRTLGNPELQPAKISNLDFRVEWFPASGEIFSASVFRKLLHNPIEMYSQQVSDDPTVSSHSYTNLKSALNWGIELEARKSLYFGAGPEWLRNIILFGNYSRIHSEVKGYYNPTTKKTNTRPMAGQSPYLVNAGILVNALHNNLSISAAYNKTGRRIIVIGQVLNALGKDDYPDVYEAPRNQLDFQVSQRLFKQRLELRINAANLINDPFVQYQDYDNNGKYSGTTFDSAPYYRKSYSNYTFTVSYTFR